MKMIFIGDSLTEFFDWQERFPAYEVGNFGIAGETAEELHERMPRLRTKADGADFCFIMTGANNVAMGDYETTESIRGIVGTVVSWEGNISVVLQSVLPMILPWVENEGIHGLNDQIEKIAREMGANYIDIFSLFFHDNGQVRQDCLLDDGVHLSGEGYRIWSNAVEKFILNRRAV